MSEKAREIFDEKMKEKTPEEVKEFLFSYMSDDYYESYEGSEQEEYPLEEFIESMLR